MRKSISNQKVKAIIQASRPWVAMLLLLVVLRVTGILAGVSYIAQSAIFKTGLMDAKPSDTPVKPSAFDYNFTVKDLNGSKVDIAQFKGKVIFLNLWATWCGPCRMEMPSIQSLYNKLDKDKVVFLMLSLDNEGSEPKIVKYIKEKEFNFPVYTPHEFLPSQLKVSTIPTTFIVGKDGKIRDKKVGAENYDSEKFLAYMNSLISE
jgi:thiol-disulfide isomerase/thioredoxin